ncbi:hypothetical protein IGI04_012846 [Brassica rapa subsp. trilocularis]|uniref:Replication factor A C-terminal domain-containing protein n=1 Tax=Brassica rapa subsp. trilocularis TaxID=1813537 RepID=A0ABQ7N742_BRACM|nr:hypothetical protein IGI04_012846 [Brassica rapa subsp. trilocularis]
MYSNLKRTLPTIEGNILNGKGAVNLSQHTFITISKLLDILSEEFEQDKVFRCHAKIIEVCSRSGWNYISCDKCKNKLKKDGDTLVCETCPHQDITGSLRYRVELIVDDGSDTASFIIFNKDVTKILNKSPVELINYIETINDVET